MIVAWIIGLVANLIYYGLPAVITNLLIAIPRFIISLADPWWCVSLFLAIVLLWTYDFPGLSRGYTGSVLRGRTTSWTDNFDRDGDRPPRAGGGGTTSPDTDDGFRGPRVQHRKPR